MKRQRGESCVLVVSRRSVLPKRPFFTFTNAAEAAAYWARREALLDRVASLLSGQDAGIFVGAKPFVDLGHEGDIAAPRAEHAR